MRVAVVADIHGNLTALEAVIGDLRLAAPDVVLHGGDVADGGSGPVEVVDWIRNLGWPGVMGNTDEMLVRPDALENFARPPLKPKEGLNGPPQSMWEKVREIAAATREKLGEERLAWLRDLPEIVTRSDFGLAVVHAKPGDCWRAPRTDASDEELQKIYGPLGEPVVAYEHTHVPSIRRLSGTVRTLINTGSVGLPYDGDARASYLLIDGGEPSIQRVEYDVDGELLRLAQCGLPGAAWTAKMLRARGPSIP